MHTSDWHVSVLCEFKFYVPDVDFLHHEASVETLGTILVKHETSKEQNNKAHIMDGARSKCW